ncbi:hypothetical protein ACOMHN_021032 [Nucella lapillus]
MATIRGSLRLDQFRRSFCSGTILCNSKSYRLKGRKTSSQQWLKRQWSDPFVKKAKAENYRCRSAFKLLEIDERHRLLRPGNVVIDCGAAPGSWTQVAVEKVCQTTCVDEDEENGRREGLVIGIDLEHMMPVEGAYILHQSDFTLPDTQDKVRAILGGRPVDVVLSDMAPRATGQKSLDHELIVKLCFSVLVFARSVLRPGGHLVCKLWQGGEQQKLESAMGSIFEKVKVVKPSSSRTDSSEIFLFGKNFRSVN